MALHENRDALQNNEFLFMSYLCSPSIIINPQNFGYVCVVLYWHIKYLWHSFWCYSIDELMSDWWQRILTIDTGSFPPRKYSSEVLNWNANFENWTFHRWKRRCFRFNDDDACLAIEGGSQLHVVQTTTSRKTFTPVINQISIDTKIIECPLINDNRSTFADEQNPGHRFPEHLFSRAIHTTRTPEEQSYHVYWL